MRKLVALTLALIGLLTVAGPALACGVDVPQEGDGAIVQERALIRWLEGREDIVMEMSVTGEAASAAWILPVPNPATVELADPAIFDELEEITKPTVVEKLVYRDDPVFTGEGAAPAGPPPVTVLEQLTLGPFQVATLAATDAAALSEWLAEHGYPFPAGLETVLAPYVEMSWTYVAITLQPELKGSSGDPSAEGVLAGVLDPLQISFDSDTIVYPMLPEALGAGSIPIFLYVLAEHRVERSDEGTFGVSEDIPYAGWLAPEDLAANSSLARFVSEKLFLTKAQAFIPDVTRVDRDITFAFAAEDTPQRATQVRNVYVDRNRPLTERWPCVTGLAPLALLLGVALVRTRRPLARPRREG